jgi:hypothetical protein
MKQKKITEKDIKNFTNFVALENYINNLLKEQREEILDDYNGFITEIWNSLEDDLTMDKTGESGYKDEKEVIKAIKKYTLKAIKRKAKQLNQKRKR